MSKVTMQDIADELGISRVTVWKVFNNHSGVSEAVRESVLQKAKELGLRDATSRSRMSKATVRTTTRTSSTATTTASCKALTASISPTR